VPPRGPIRYLRLGGVLTAAQADDVRAVLRTHKVRGAAIEKLPIRDPTAGAEAAALVGKVGHYDDGKVKLDDVGVLGAERLLEGVLAGDPGSVRYVRDARGRPLWMDPGSVRPPSPGDDFHLSIDLELQRLCHEELSKGVLDQNAQGGRLVMIDPATGEVLAMVDIVRTVDDAAPFPWADKPPPRKKGELAPKVASMSEGKPRRYVIIPEDKNRATHPALARNRCIEDMYEPGSTFKPFVWSTINELGLIRLDEVIDTEGGRWRLPIGRYLEDVVKRDRQTWYDVLVNSSNIGMVKGAGRLTPQQLHDACIRFGFGKPTGLGLPGRPVAGESAGAVTPLNRWSRFTHTSVPYGHEIGVTPVQMARAFAVFAREGELAGTLPRLRLDAVSSGDPQGVIYRVLPPDIALGVREPLAKVASKMEETMKTGLKQPAPEEGWRYPHLRQVGHGGRAARPRTRGQGPAPGLVGVLRRSLQLEFHRGGANRASSPGGVRGDRRSSTTGRPPPALRRRRRGTGGSSRAGTLADVPGRGALARSRGSARRRPAALIACSATQRLHRPHLSFLMKGAGMKIADLVSVMKRIAPLEYAESWDKVGLLVGAADRELKGPVLLTVDLSEAVIEEADRLRAGAVIAYHPPIWEPLARVTDGTPRQRVVMWALERGLGGVLSPHRSGCGAGRRHRLVVRGAERRVKRAHSGRCPGPAFPCRAFPHARGQDRHLCSPGGA
jgi:hypothetical protein